MSLPLQDLGSVKVEQLDHSILKAEADVLGMPVVTLATRILHDHVQRQLEVYRMANALHESKGHGEILSDRRRG